MEKIHKRFRFIEPVEGMVSYEVALLAIMDKLNEIVDWIKKHERIMVKDRDWALAKLGEIEDRKSAATKK